VEHGLSSHSRAAFAARHRTLARQRRLWLQYLQSIKVLLIRRKA
jgi:hypothetical protein